MVEVREEEAGEEEGAQMIDLELQRGAWRGGIHHRIRGDKSIVVMLESQSWRGRGEARYSTLVSGLTGT